MDLRRYWGELNNWTPENEEERRDQQFYIGIMMEAEELYRKEKMPDEEYERNISLIDDEAQRQQFMDDHISESEFVKELDDIHEIFAEMNRKYGIGQDVIENENDVEVARKREELLAIQAYYRVLNDGRAANIMANVDFENMPQNDLIDEYERVLIAMSRSGNNFSEYVRLGREVLEREERERTETVKDVYRQRVRDRLREKGIMPNSTPSGNTDYNNGSNSTDTPSGDSDNSSNDVTDKATEEERINEKIEKFRTDAEKMKAEIDKVKVELVLGEENKLFELTDAVRGLETELSELANDAENLKSEIDAFVLETGSADFSMTPAQIEKRVDELKRGVKDLKQKLVSKYDARVAMTNAKIAELKSRTDLDPEIQDIVDGLEELPICGVVVKNWKHNKFMSDIDFNKLVEVNKTINNIQNRLISEPELPKLPPKDNIESGDGNNGNDAPSVDDNGLEADISAIEGAIEQVESEIVPSLTAADIDRLIKQDLQIIADNIDDFKLRLESNRDKLTDEEYNNYVSRIEDAEANLAQLYSQLKSMDNTKSDKNQDYDELVERANKISVNIDKLFDDVVAFHGHIVESAISVFEGRLYDLESELNTFKNVVESKHNQGKIDDNQYNSLMNRINDMKQKLSATNEKLKDPGMIKDADIFALLNGEIDGLEVALTNLEEQVEKLDKPIKRETRKEIDRIIKHLEKEIARLEKLAEHYKDKDPEKYNKLVGRLNGLKDRLDKVGKKYRSKCPLMVEAVKSAKNFFKKHKKVCLIVAGLAAIALVHATIGPVIIPALMHGNLMLMNTVPALRPFLKFTNNILGGMINASIKTVSIGNTTFNGWVLANGVVINPTCAATSLLKGLAISGLSSTALMAPLVIAIKKLVEKMKTTELKQKLVEEKEKLKAKMPAKKEKTEKKPSTKKADKMSVDELAMLLKEYRKSGKSMDEFCKENNLSNEEKMILQYLETRSRDNIEEMKNSSKKGR